MEYFVDGRITLSTSSKVRLNSNIEFTSPTEAQVILSSESDDYISVSIKLKADDDTVAMELARLELTRTSNLLSFRDVDVNRIQITKLRSPERSSTSIVLTATPKYVITLGNSLVATLTTDLEKSYSPEFEEVVSLWGQAVSRESSVEKFFLLYRLMERLHVAKNIDSWIVAKEPGVKKVPNERRRGVYTIYHFLRDNIHPISGVNRFPIKELNDNLPEFKCLVQLAIKEHFGL